MPRYEPVTMTFPPFGGMVRRLVLANIAVFFAMLVLGYVLPDVRGGLVDVLRLQPSQVAHGHVWQLATYSFLNPHPMGILFGMLTLWFCGSIVEGGYGSRWFAELYFTSAIGGAVLACALSYTRLLHMDPVTNWAMGVWPALFGVLTVIALRFGDMRFMPIIFLRFTIEARYMVAIYLLIYMALLLRGGDALGALTILCGALCGWLYLKFAPRRGMGFGLSEQMYGARNWWYRSKRRRAARKFEVYMGKQGRTVKFDSEGKYIDPEEERHDPNDKRWMN